MIYVQLCPAFSTEALLKKRQNGYFSEADQIRLQELIDTRDAIAVKYHLSPANVDGFDTIRQKLEAEVARAQARGQSDADVMVYENAMVAAAEGLAAMNSEIDAQYDKEYALIQLIEDSAERQTAMDALNAKYVEDRRNAAMEYAQLLSGIVAPVWEQEGIRKAATDVDLLNQKLREYSAASESEKPAILAEINALTAAMDEGAMTEYIAMLMQIQSLLDSGMTDAGRVILETDITAENLSTSNLLATYALINRIDAARIDVDQLFAREAFIAKLRTSEIIAGKSLTIIAGEAAEAKQKADNAVAQVQVLYASGPSSAVAPAAGWSTVAPAHQEGQYIWQKTVTTFNNGATESSMPTCLSGADGEPATTLRIDSSRGTVFKNNAVSTVLSAVIYRGGVRITDMNTLRSTFGSGAYLQWSWQRLDEERFGVISASDSRLINDGFSFVLSADDVDTKVTFMCELITN